MPSSVVVMTTAMLTTSASAPAKARTPWRALPIVLLAQFLSVLDFFIVNVALPDIGRTLRAGPAALQFVVAGYGLAFACCLVAGGRLGDGYGRRRVFTLGVAGFTVASALCGLAPDAGALIAARVLQGVAAGAMVPQVLATIQATFTGADRQRALGLFGAVIGSACVAGQLLGGVLVSADIAGNGWRPIFLVNVPVGVLALLVSRAVPDSRAPGRARIDARGAALLAVTLLALLVPLAVGRQEGWPVWCWVSLAATPVLAGLFWTDQRRTERRGGSPLLPPSLMAQSGMRRGLPLALLFFPSFGGFMLTTAVTLQTGRGMSALDAGLALAPLALSFLATALVAKHVVARFGRATVAAGGLGFAAGLVLFAAQAWRGYPSIDGLSLVPAMMLIGVGTALVMVPLFGVILAAVPAAVAGAASGVLTTTQQSGLALGAGTLGTLFYGLLGAGDWRGATIGTLLAEAALVLTAAVAAGLLPAPGSQR
jgi:MFS family permease